MQYDVLIIGGGVAGVSCALTLGSAYKKAFVSDKKIAILTHQRGSNLQDALLNNVYGIPAGKLGSEVLTESLAHLTATYPHIEQIANQRAHRISKTSEGYLVYTSENIYEVKNIVVAVGAASTFDIDGLNQFVMPHLKAAPEKNRIQLKNEDHLVTEGIYVAGTLAGHRSQVAIAAGSGAAVATDILTLWNNGKPTHTHDSIRKKD